MPPVLTYGWGGHQPVRLSLRSLSEAKATTTPQVFQNNIRLFRSEGFVSYREIVQKYLYNFFLQVRFFFQGLVKPARFQTWMGAMSVEP